MRRALVLLGLATLALAGGASGRGTALVQPASLVYQGAFRLPAGDTDATSFAYGGTALAFNPASNSLFVVGHDWYQLTAEVSVPQPVVSSKLAKLNRATFLQPLTDATDGLIDETGGTNNKIGGQLVWQGRLYGTAYVYYDAAGEQVVSHWARPSTSLATGSATGLYRLGRLGAGMVSGYLAEIPREWRDRLGGPALTGQCCIPIVSRTSFCPSAFAFKPAELGKSSPVAARPLVYYTQDHHTIGDWDQTWNPSKGILYNGTTAIRGAVFPAGTDTVLFFGTQGVGKFCYGEGTDDPDLAGQPTGDGSIWCYDPDDSSKGTHGYPYQARVWAFDANDLYRVRTGQAEPWSVRPYATWRLALGFRSQSIGGAAYDPATGRIFVSQQFADGTSPLVHVFTVQ